MRLFVSGLRRAKLRPLMKFSDVTPNLVVSDVVRSLAFYRDVLGFSLITTVPEAAPFAFAWMQRDNVNVFLNSVEAVRADHPELASRALGGTATLFIMLEAESLQTGVDAMLASIGSRAKLIMAFAA